MATHVVRLRTLYGVWETCGVDRLRGISPENLQIEANAYGADKASFDLRRDPGGIYPDLTAFTPVTIDVDQERVFKGRISETPAQDGSSPSINVQCEGDQYRLDDDLYRRVYVHTALSGYQDLRSFASADLTKAHAGGSVSSSEGIATISWEDGTVVPAAGTVGVMLDLGIGQTASRIVMEWESSNNAAAVTCYVRGSDSEEPIAVGPYDNAFSFAMNSGASGTSSGTLATSRRYVAVLLYHSAGATLTADIYLKIKSIKVFADAAWETGNESILKASDVVKDARDRATVFISSSDERIESTSFSLPEFAPSEHQTARAIINAANIYHDYLFQVDNQGRLVFEQKPSTPIFEAGNWAGTEFTDASNNNGDEIYNRVLLTGEDAAGAPLLVERYATDVAGSLFPHPISTPSLSNPSFTTNTTGWTATTNLTLSRDTGSYDSSPASMLITPAAPYIGTVTAAFTGTFEAGLTYQLKFKAVAASARYLAVYFGEYNTDYAYTSASLSTSWDTVTLTWVPSSDCSSATVTLFNFPGTAGAAAFHVDTFELYQIAPTLVDKHGFRRTKVLQMSSPTTAAAATQIADTWLTNHYRSQLKGSIKVTAGGIRQVIGGGEVKPHQLLNQVGQLVRLTHRLDPDDGSRGRIGRIVAVKYVHNDPSATVELDNERQSFEALLSRYALIAGQVR